MHKDERVEHASSFAPLQRQAEWLNQYRFSLRPSEEGSVLSVADGVAWVKGLPTASMDEIISFEDGSEALVFDLSKERVGVILTRQTDRLSAGTLAHLSGRSLSVPVGDALLGRIIDPLGTPLDGLGPIEATSFEALDVLSPPIVKRDFVRRPLYTGNKIIDTLIPIGKGQRQLILGDNGTGKSSLAIDTIINQKGKEVLCICVLIGQKRSTVVSTIETLRSAGALTYSTVVIAEATVLPGVKFLAPFSGCTIAEAWMRQGKDTLVVYDDLTTHARTYRELSLLLRRPPGREAYPADIFFLHSRLLERSTCLAPAYGGGTMTSLPVVETEQGEIATYIPTNLISITDGQLYLDQRLFSAGFLPAIDVARSVSRIGGRAQHPWIKDLAGRIKLEYLQFLELEVFTRFGSRLDPETERKIRRGKLLRELLKQDRLSPLPIEFQIAWLLAFQRGLFDDLDLEKIRPLLLSLLECVQKNELTLEQSREKWDKVLAEWSSGRPTPS